MDAIGEGNLFPDFCGKLVHMWIECSKLERL